MRLQLRAIIKDHDNGLIHYFKDNTDFKMQELKYKEITGKIIGAYFEVHKFPGNGFQEVIYQRAFA